MTNDKLTAKAREIAAKAHSDPQNIPILAGDYDRTPAVKAARLGIIEGRRQAFEEAARVADEHCITADNDVEEAYSRAAIEIATTIRALIEEQP